MKASRNFPQHPECMNFRTEVSSFDKLASCPFNPTGSSNSVLFWGDSHMEQFHPVIEKLFENNQFSFGALFAISAGCSASRQIDFRDKGYHCIDFNKAAFDRAQQSDIKAVVISFASGADWSLSEICHFQDGICDAKIHWADAERYIVEDLVNYATILSRLGKKVILILPTPIYSVNIPPLIIRNAILGIDMLPHRDDGLIMRDLIQRSSLPHLVELIDPRIVLCPTGKCFFEKDNISIYSDLEHLTISSSSLFENFILQALKSIN